MMAIGKGELGFWLKRGVGATPADLGGFLAGAGTTGQRATLTGPLGYGARQFLPLGQPFPYTVQLENAAEYYGRELEYRLKKLTSLFEPAVIIFMGLIVGFVAVALISAMYGVFNSSKMLNSGPK